ncbi:MAG TPA: phytanoyl-CoA dioxygenase family protein [Pyrinomonadaceae bacterium]|jgi:ectoine hydroxylase-related dioxygenase (phytanoyl-CoA dioxygenase family)
MNELGYSIEEGVLSVAECGELLNSLEPLFSDERRGGVRHLMSSCQQVRHIAEDQRLKVIAERSLGKPAIPFKATLFCKTSRANWLVSWHQDTALPLVKFEAGDEWGPWSRKGGIDYALAPAWALERIVALRIQLDASDESNGPLRLIEGSHKFGVLDAVAIDNIVREGCEVVATSGAGGVIAMSPLIVHASSKTRSNKPRRVLHIEYSDSLEVAAGIRLAVA